MVRGVRDITKILDKYPDLGNKGLSDEQIKKAYSQREWRKRNPEKQKAYRKSIPAEKKTEYGRNYARKRRSTKEGADSAKKYSRDYYKTEEGGTKVRGYAKKRYDETKIARNTPEHLRTERQNHLVKKYQEALNRKSAADRRKRLENAPKKSTPEERAKRKFNRPFSEKLKRAQRAFDYAKERSVKSFPSRIRPWLMNPGVNQELLNKFLFNQIFPRNWDVGHIIKESDPRGILSPENTKVIEREAHKKMSAAERSTGAARLAKIYDEYLRQRDSEKKVGIREQIKRAVRTGGGVPMNLKIRGGGILDDPYSVMSWLTKDLT